MTQELIICPLCANVVHRHTRGRVSTSIKIPSRSPRSGDVFAALQQAAFEERRQEAVAAEEACVAHYVQHHALRYRLWKRFRWTWLMRWPKREPKAPLPDQQYFELTFPKRGT